MDLVQIRDMVLRRATGVKRDDVDDMINMAQHQYIQPVAKLPGIANFIKRGPEVVVGEANALDVTNTVYTTTHSPILPGSEAVYVGGTLREYNDSGYEHTIDYENGTVIFSAAQAAAVTVDYTEEDSMLLTTIASDIYKITAIKEVIGAGIYGDIPFRSFEDGDRIGVRLYNDRLYFQGIPAGTPLAVHYWKTLSELGSGSGQVATPEIPAQWHDLYWLGALALLRPAEWYSQFAARLDAFTQEMTGRDTVQPARRRPIKW